MVVMEIKAPMETAETKQSLNKVFNLYNTEQDILTVLQETPRIFISELSTLAESHL